MTKSSLNQERACNQRESGEDVEFSFDLQLVVQFVATIRGKGAVVLSSSNSRYSAELLSTPALVWLFSNRTALPLHDVLDEILDFDFKRQQTIVGHNIFKDRSIKKYPELEFIHEEALSIIKLVWPEIFELIRTIRPRVSFQTEDRAQFESESDPKTFGEIIYNMKNQCPVHWAEIMVHEIAHHYLTVLLGTMPLDAKTKDKFKESLHSFQRQSQRPLIGILHGVFAQSCILIFATKILLDDSSNEAWKSGAQKTFDRYASIFPNDLKTITDNQLFFHPAVKHLSEIARDQVEKVHAGGSKCS